MAVYMYVYIYIYIFIYISIYSHIIYLRYLSIWWCLIVPVRSLLSSNLMWYDLMILIHPYSWIISYFFETDKLTENFIINFILTSVWVNEQRLPILSDIIISEYSTRFRSYITYYQMLCIWDDKYYIGRRYQMHICMYPLDRER